MWFLNSVEVVIGTLYSVQAEAVARAKKTDEARPDDPQTEDKEEEKEQKVEEKGEGDAKPKKRATRKSKSDLEAEDEVGNVLTWSFCWLYISCRLVQVDYQIGLHGKPDFVEVISTYRRYHYFTFLYIQILSYMLWIAQHNIESQHSKLNVYTLIVLVSWNMIVVVLAL